jgi:hypothetical protein
MPERLTEQERVWFEGRRITPDWAKDQQWECTRVELNAFTAPDLIAYIEAGLNAAGATGKLVPPPDVLTDTARRSHRQVMGEWVDARIAELFDTGQLTDQLAAEYETVVITDPAGWVATRHADDQSTWWRQAIDAAIRARLAEVDDRLRDRLDELLNIGNQ